MGKPSSFNLFSNECSVEYAETTAGARMLSEQIITARLTLRPFRFSDVPEMFNYLQEPEMGRFLEGDSTLPTEAEVEGYIARHILVDRTQRNVWAITMDDAPIGGISINFMKNQRIAEIGYSIKKPLWGRGLATEATRAVIDAAFETCADLQRIQANIHPQNTGSIRVVERVGMNYEGTLRAYAWVAGEVTDEAVYAILRTTWLAARARPQRI
jgi:[ribosomal protein S5]-alanine N-acetyltransferase